MFKKTLSVCAIASCFSGAACAADISLYGFIDLGPSYTNVSVSGASDKAKEVGDKSSLTLRSNVNKGSRWGIRGKEELGNGLEAGFVLESGFTPDTGEMTFSNRLFGRQATVFLKGNLGEIAFGRTGALSSGAGTYAITGWGSPFGTSWGTYSAANHNYMFGYIRLDNMVTYRTPEWNGLQFSAQYSFGTDSKKDYDATLEGTQNDEGTSKVDRYAAIGTSYKAGPINLGLVVDTWMYGNVKASAYDDNAVSVTATGSYDWSFMRFFLGMQYFRDASKDNIKVFNTFDAKSSVSAQQDGWALTTGINVPVGGGDAKFAVGYFTSEPSKAGNAFDRETTRWGASTAYEYFLSKNTSVYGVVSYVQDKLEINSIGTDKYKIVEASLGLMHKF
mgnify:CR=1 FL=1